MKKSEIKKGMRFIYHIQSSHYMLIVTGNCFGKKGIKCHVWIREFDDKYYKYSTTDYFQLEEFKTMRIKELF